MTPLSHAPALFTFLKKVYSSFSLPMLLVSTTSSLGMAKIFDQLIVDTPVKDLLLPLLVGSTSLSLYFFVFLLDFASGVHASRSESIDKKGYFKSDRGWSSIWKISSMFILIVGATLFSIIGAIASKDFVHWGFMILSGTVAIMATSFDIVSIGENIYRITGKKSAIFEWLSSTGSGFGSILKDSLFQKIKKLLS